MTVGELPAIAHHAWRQRSFHNHCADHEGLLVLPSHETRGEWMRGLHAKTRRNISSGIASRLSHRRHSSQKTRAIDQGGDLGMLDEVSSVWLASWTSKLSTSQSVYCCSSTTDPSFMRRVDTVSDISILISKRSVFLVQLAVLQAHLGVLGVLASSN